MNMLIFLFFYINWILNASTLNQIWEITAQLNRGSFFIQLILLNHPQNSATRDGEHWVLQQQAAIRWWWGLVLDVDICFWQNYVVWEVSDGLSAGSVLWRRIIIYFLAAMSQEQESCQSGLERQLIMELCHTVTRHVAHVGSCSDWPTSACSL